MILGMAGHVDHGKTAVVRQLSGVDIERAQEKKRGLTIDLGFTSLITEHGTVALVDVPGHESFTGNMLAGATGFHSALLVISAKEGIQQQTIEHLQILKTLGVKSIAVVLSKCDLSESSERTRRKAAIGELFQRMNLCTPPVFPVSSTVPFGFESVLKWITDVKANFSAPNEVENQPFRMPVDRCFSKTGRGCIVTGMVWSGKISVGDQVVLLPEMTKAKVRGLESHYLPRTEIRTGERAAINLSKLPGKMPKRGMELVSSKIFQPTQACPCWGIPFSTVTPLKQGQQYRVYTATSKVWAKLLIRNDLLSKPGAAILKFDSPIIVEADQNFVLRSSDGKQTLAGGRFLGCDAINKMKNRDVLKLVEALKNHESDSKTRLRIWVEKMGECSGDAQDLHRSLGGQISAIKSAREELVNTGELILLSDQTLMARERSRFIQSKIKQIISNSVSLNFLDESELRKMISGSPSQIAINHSLNELIGQGGGIREGSQIVLGVENGILSEKDEKLFKRIMNCYLQNRSGPNRAELIKQLGARNSEVKRLLRFAESNGHLVRAPGEFYFTPAVLDMLWRQLVVLFDSDSELTVTNIRDHWRLTRKHVIPLLEHFDSEGLTQRTGRFRTRGRNFLTELPGKMET